MVWHTHRLAWIALPIFVMGLMSVNEVWPNGQVASYSALYHVNLLVLCLAPWFWNLPDLDQNQWNTPADVYNNFKKQWIIEQSLRILFKNMSWWEHRWFTHSILFMALIAVVISPMLLFWFWIYDLIFLILALASHAFIDMFNNSWARILYPIKTKFNFLNLIPNLLLLKTWKKDQVRSKWWDLSIWIRIIWLVIFSIVSVQLYWYIQAQNFHIILKLLAFVPLFYIFLKLMFVKTGSEEEKILWQYPLVLVIAILIFLNIWWIFVAYQNATIWLANHPIFLVGLIIFMAIKWMKIINANWRDYVDAKELGWAIASIIIIWTVIFKFPLIIDEIWRLRWEVWKPREISVMGAYENSFDKLQSELKSLWDKTPVKINEAQQEWRWVFGAIDEMKNWWLQEKSREMIENNTNPRFRYK